MKEEFKMVMVLTAVCLVSSVALSLLYNKVKTNIEKQEKAKIEKALRFVMPAAGEFEKVETEEEVEYWRVKSPEGQLLGYTFIARKQGFSSEIKVMVGIRPDATITRTRVIAQAETPGLGANMELVESDRFLWDVFSGKGVAAEREEEKAPFFLEQFRELDARKLVVVKSAPDKEDNEIQALTGATISSQAVVDGIEEAVDIIIELEKE